MYTHQTFNEKLNNLLFDFEYIKDINNIYKSTKLLSL
jgi:hypothetical protein